MFSDIVLRDAADEIDIEGLESGYIDRYTGILLEPTVEFFTVVADGIMSILSSIMLQKDFQFVMVRKDKIQELSSVQNAQNIGGTYTIDSMKNYRRLSGSLDFIRYPYFPYSPEEIFSGKIDILDANFISSSNTNKDIRSTVIQWYLVLRMITIIGLLCMLIYTGLKIIISSNASNKSKYKEMLINWFIAVILAFSMHYIMAFILAVIEEFTSMLSGLTGTIRMNANGQTFTTNLMGIARFQIQQNNFNGKVGHLVIYIALVVYTIKFTFVYLKRVLMMAFLTVISPIVALLYPIDKMDGDARTFKMWIREFIFNALLQPMHYILYYILVSSTISLAVNNPIYGIVALAFMSQAEKLLKRIFGFGKARMGTVGGIAGAFATGAITSTLINGVSGGKKKSKGKNQKNNSYYYEPTNYIEDTLDEDMLLGLTWNRNIFINNNEPEKRTKSETNKQYLVNNLGSRDNMIRILEDYKYFGGDLDDIPNLEGLSNKELKALIQNRVLPDEDISKKIKGLYIDTENDTREDTGDNTGDDTGDNKGQYTRQGTGKYERTGSRLSTKSGTRLDEKSGTRLDVRLGTRPDTIPEEEEESVRHKFNPKPVIKGIKNVGKTISRPVWDFDKGTDIKSNIKYNGKRIVGGIVRGTAGLSVGIAAAAVQTGISITDGKYKMSEGVATIGAGMAVVSGATKKAKNAKAEYNRENEAIEKYSENWTNRDDVIKRYRNQYGQDEKKMRKRAADNYVSRGITDFKDQKQGIKFADQIRQERGIDIEEADKIAVATLQYRKQLKSYSSYDVLYNKKKRDNYTKLKADAYSGSASRKSIIRLHEDLIENVVQFDEINK